jgi:hypothetical protein
VDVRQFQVEYQACGHVRLSACRNSVAEANTATSRPADARRLDSASRTRASSSTTKTTGLSRVMALHSDEWARRP